MSPVVTDSRGWSLFTGLENHLKIGLILKMVIQIWNVKSTDLQFLNIQFFVREASNKKSSLKMAGPLRPPLELNGRWNVRTLEKKVKKKVIFSLMAYGAFKRRIFCYFPKPVNNNFKSCMLIFY